MVKKYRLNIRLKIIYISIVILFVFVLAILRYAFNRSRNLLIQQEIGIISQVMNRNELAVEEVMDAVRKLSAVSNTHKQIASLLNESYKNQLYSSENASRIRSLEEELLFYKNIFMDYRIHYVIMGADGTIYSIADGIENSAMFGKQLLESVKQQAWFHEFMEKERVSCWVAPCMYDKKGVIKEEGDPHIFFVRRIQDYNTQKYLGVSIVSFPIDNFSELLTPYGNGGLMLLNQENQPVYTRDSENYFEGVNVEDLTAQFNKGQGHFYFDKQNVSYLVNYQKVEDCGWYLVNMIPIMVTTQAVDHFYRSITGLVFLIALAAAAVCLAMYIYINAPLNRLVRRVSSVNIGGTRVSEAAEISRPSFGIAETEMEINRMVDYIEELSAQALKQRDIEQNLRYEMLRAQLNPHFLFNTLNIIKWSAMMSGAANIADMITSLGILLENTMNRGEKETALREEIKVVKAWAEIKNWGLKNRIQIYCEIPDDLLDFRVIRFFLQPLVENAVLHGMNGQENGEIRIQAEREDMGVCVSVHDNGSGIDAQTLERICRELDGEYKRRHVTGIGLKSIHELMKTKYGPEYGLTIESDKMRGTTVYALFPDREDKHNAESNDRG